LKIAINKDSRKSMAALEKRLDAIEGAIEHKFQDIKQLLLKPRS